MRAGMGHPAPLLTSNTAHDGNVLSVITPNQANPTGRAVDQNIIREIPA